MDELQKTRIPDRDKVFKDGKVRAWSEDYLPLIYSLTDAAMYLSTLEIRNDRKAISEFKRTINDVRKSLWEFRERIRVIKMEKGWAFQKKELPIVRGAYQGLFYLEGFESPYRELLSKYFTTLEEFNAVVPLMNKVDIHTFRRDFIKLQSAVDNLIVSIEEWNSRVNEIKVWVWRKTSVFKKNLTHKYHTVNHDTKQQNII